MQRRNLYERMIENPNDVDYEDLAALLLWLGFSLKDGTHPLFTHREAGIRIRLAKPHGKSGRKTIKSFYVKEFIAQLEQHPEIWERK